MSFACIVILANRLSRNSKIVDAAR